MNSNTDRDIHLVRRLAVFGVRPSMAPWPSQMRTVGARRSATLAATRRLRGARRPPRQRGRHGPSRGDEARSRRRCAASHVGRRCLDSRRRNRRRQIVISRVRNAASRPRTRRWSPRRTRPWSWKIVLLSRHPGTEPSEPLIVARARGGEDASRLKCAREWASRRFEIQRRPGSSRATSSPTRSARCAR